MNRTRQYRRLALCALLLAIAFAGLGYRLVDLQVLRHEELREEALKAWHKTVVRPTRRGQILDARGQVLATGLPVKTVCANPTWVGTNVARIARALAPVLKVPESELIRRLQPRQVLNAKGDKVDLQRVVLKKHVALEEWAQVEQAISRLTASGPEEGRLSARDRARLLQHRLLLSRSVFCDPVDGEVRHYPNGTLAAHVLGFTGLRDQPVPGAPDDEIVGKTGIESSFNPVLSGIRGWRQTLRDGARRELVALRPLDVAPRAGLSVVLTLDAGVQHIVESELEQAQAQHQPVSISAVVVRPATGEILALANLPTFDPNRPGATPAATWRNRVITDVAEPGSTFKTLVISGALDAGVVSLGDTFHCENGQFHFKGQRLGDVHPYGTLTVQEIVAKSSNIGAAKVGIELGADALYAYLRAFGIGDPTQVPLGGEVAGLFRSPRSWSKISVAWIPMGHEVATTPLQMVMAVSAIANRGRLMRPMLVSALLDEDGAPVARFEPTCVRQVVREATARQMVAALKLAVAAGTGKKAQLEFYDVAGKTGTAQKIVDGAYSHSKHYASFIGFFPADDPQVCIAVMLDEPRKGMYGGETAAPVFRRIAERAAAYLAIPPTRGPEGPLFTRDETAARTVPPAPRHGGAPAP